VRGLRASTTDRVRNPCDTRLDAGSRAQITITVHRAPPRLKTLNRLCARVGCCPTRLRKPVADVTIRSILDSLQLGKDFPEKEGKVNKKEAEQLLMVMCNRSELWALLVPDGIDPLEYAEPV
jgi:hypothetical protein